jgi:hypothetical protein
MLENVSILMREQRKEKEEKQEKQEKKEKDAERKLKVIALKETEKNEKKANKEKKIELDELEEKVVFLKKNWENRAVFLRLGGASQNDINNLEKNIKQIENKIFELKKDLVIIS